MIFFNLVGFYLLVLLVVIFPPLFMWWIRRLDAQSIAFWKLRKEAIEAVLFKMRI